MPKIEYVAKKFGHASVTLIDKCNEIIDDYTAQGFVLTLRQLYYQLVSRDIIPNRMKEYKHLGSIVNDARLAGLIDWTAIEDRTRNLRELPHWSTPSELMEAVSQQFRTDMWSDQQYRPEVWIEKDALIGVIEDVCQELDVPHFSCRGYTSQSEMWAAARRLRRYAGDGQTPIIFHLGDHDPSGKDMTRDIIDRLRLFMGGLEVKRLALNMNQVEEYDPPPNPAKTTDSRYAAYIADFGAESWELDALEPSLISNLIRTSIMELIDGDLWDDRKRDIEKHRRTLGLAAKNWTVVEKAVRRTPPRD